MEARVEACAAVPNPAPRFHLSEMRGAGRTEERTDMDVASCILIGCEAWLSAGIVWWIWDAMRWDK